MDILQLLLTIISTLILIIVLVTVHEFGHFIAAKLFGVEVKEFAIGFGKRIFQRNYKGTLYAIRMIPLGGFVEIEGEIKSASPNSFRNRPAYQKCIILAAGVVMNILLSLVLLTIFLYSNNFQFTSPALTDYTFNNTDIQVKAYPLLITSVDPEGNSAGQLVENETIIGVEGVRFSSYPEFQSIIKEKQGEVVTFEFFDFDTFDVVTRDIQLGFEDEKGAILNVTLNQVNQVAANVSYPAYYLKYPQNLSAGVSLTTDLVLYVPKAVFSLIGNAFQTGDFNELGNSLGGPLQIANQSNEIIQLGLIEAFIPLAGLLSISLAVFNILPFPALDGGQIAVVLVETAIRRKVPDSILEKINLFGFLFLMGLFVLVTFKDIIQLNIINRLADFVRNIF